MLSVAEITSLHAEILSEIAISACRDVISARDSYLCNAEIVISATDNISACRDSYLCQRWQFLC